MSRIPPEDSKERILNYLLQSDALRRDLKAQAARALRNHGASTSPLSRSVRLLPAALQRELEVLSPLLGSRSQSLQKQRPSLRHPRRKPAFCGCQHSQQPVSRCPEKPAKRRRRVYRHRLPPLKLFRPDAVLQRIYQPRQTDIASVPERRPITKRTPSPMRVKTSEALLTPILEAQSLRMRKSTKSPIGDGALYASRVTL